MARCLMIDAKLNHKYWQYATIMAAFIKNWTPTTLDKDTISPFKAMWGQNSNFYNLPLFGCKSRVYIFDILTKKLNPKTKDCIFFGYAKGIKARVFEYVATS